MIDFNRFGDKAQVRRATLSCDSSYFLKTMKYTELSEAITTEKLQLKCGVLLRIFDFPQNFECR